MASLPGFEESSSLTDKKRRNSDSTAPNDDGDTKKLRRQARNREAARQCRKRKKKHTEEMEARIQQLEGELAHLRNASAPATRSQIVAGRNFHVTQLRHLVASDTITESAASQVILNILRISANAVGPNADLHVTALLELLEPFPYMKFLMWGIGCNDSFFATDTQGRSQGLWALLQKELKMTPEQAEKIKEMRDRMKSQVRSYMVLLDTLKKLQDDLRQYISQHDKNLHELRRVLPPVGQARFLVWAEANETCVELVEQMWQQATASLLAELRAPPPAPVDFNFDFPLPSL